MLRQILQKKNILRGATPACIVSIVQVRCIVNFTLRKSQLSPLV